MNHQGHNVLIDAVTEHHRQARFTFHTFHIVNGVFLDADCVIGLLHLTMHSSRQEAIECVDQCLYSVLSTVPQGTAFINTGCAASLRDRYEISLSQWEEMIVLNDYKGKDFLTISRKLED